MRRSIEERTEEPKALFFGGPTPFLLARQKKWGRENRIPKATAFGYLLKDAVLEKAKGEVFGHSFPYERRLKRRPEIKER